jgi:hypothetical protein
MTFLPIVQRELRVAARKRSTFWLRLAVALVALVIGTGFMALSAASGMGTASLGSGLFRTVTWLAMAGAIGAGLFFTSDCLSEEKREGTLGLLFLTDLRGYDVVTGKCLATSLRGAQALLAFFPVLAITLLMGGVTGAQFWKATIALLNMLFASLAAGLFVSAISRETQKAMAATFFTLLALNGLGPLLDSLIAAARGVWFEPLLSFSSPIFAFVMAIEWGRVPYWQAVISSDLAAWVLLWLACLMVPRTWQDGPRTAVGIRGNRSYAWKYGATRFREAFRRKCLEKNPVLWLTRRERWQSIGIWVSTLLVLGVFSFIAALRESLAWTVWTQVSALFAAGLYLWMASQASRFFIESRRSGLLELLLVAPFDGKQIVRGQWQALLRTFGLPVALFLAAQVLGATIAQGALLGTVSVQVSGGPSLPGAWAVILPLVTGVLGTLSTAANLVALGWFGMWMGLTSKKASLASFKTILFVQVIPWLVISFVSGILVAVVLFPLMMMKSGGAVSGTVTTSVTNAGSTTVTMTTGSSGVVMAFPFVMAVVGCVMTVGKDVVFILLARRKLWSSFREMAVAGISPVEYKAPPVIAVRTKAGGGEVRAQIG